MTTEERDAMMPLAQSLVAYHDGRHAYLMGPQGAAEAESQWAVEAGTLWDYFGGGTAQVSELLAQIESEGMPVLRIPGPEWDDRTLSWIRARLGPEVWLPEPLKDPKVDEGYYYCETPATEILRVRTPEGVELAGVRYTPAPERRPREEAIVLIHGASENFYSDAMFWLGRCLAQEGFTVVALNRSDADDGFDTANFENTVLDVQAAVNALAGYRHIYLLGHSLGSVVAAAYVAQHPDPAIAGLILAAPPASYETFRIAHVDSQSYRDVARVAYGSEDPSRWLFLRWCGEIDRETQRCDARTAMLTRHSAGQFRSYLDGYATADTIANIRRVTVPVLILRSEADQVTTCQDAMAVFANAVQSPATALVEVFDKDLDSTGSRYELRSSRIGHSLVILLPIHWGGRVFSEWIDFRGMRAPSEHSHDPETSVTLDPRLRVLFSQRDASYDSSYAKAGGSRLVTGHPCIG
jgi:alpha-beta hydrolase superfamily lysophospholipase